MSERRWSIRSWTVCARAGWARLRAYLGVLNGDAAYARYLAHWHASHGSAGAPLDRGEFFRRELERRWNGVRRCC